MNANLPHTNGREEISARAYDKWIQRGWADPVRDWLNAEVEVSQTQNLLRRIGRLEEQLEAGRIERHLARQIQEGLLPKAMPAPPGFTIVGRSLPSQMVGGDYFDFFRMTDERLGMAIGDASGHGIGSALMIAETRAYLRALVLASTDLGSILALTNRRLVEDLEMGRFVTLFLAVFDPGRRSLIYSGAGHCPGYVLDGAGRTKAVLYGEGPPLGVDSTVDFPVATEIALQSGDLLLFHTDGIIEAGSTGSELFGIDRVLSLVQDHHAEPPARILDALFHAVSEFSGSEGQIDDATAVLIKVEEPASFDVC